MRATPSTEVLIKEFEGDCKLRGITRESTYQYVSRVKTFIDFIEGNGFPPILEADKKTLKAFTSYLREERGAKKRTLDNYFTALSAFYDYANYEEYTDINIIGPFRKRYLRSYKDEQVERQVPDVETLSKFINSIPKVRDRGIVLLLSKTGIRRKELLSIDLDDIEWADMSIELKETPKRSNRIVFFDHETSRLLRRWIRIREGMAPKTNALFINERGERLRKNGIYNAVVKWSTRFGLHDPNGRKIRDSFSPHCLRHWFTTWLRRNGMPREFIQELRGDKRSKAIDIYDHIDKRELKQAYLVAIPELGII